LGSQKPKGGKTNLRGSSKLEDCLESQIRQMEDLWIWLDFNWHHKRENKKSSGERMVQQSQDDEERGIIPWETFQSQEIHSTLCRKRRSP
jgi:hypothetical protein